MNPSYPESISSLSSGTLSEDLNDKGNNSVSRDSSDSKTLSVGSSPKPFHYSPKAGAHHRYTEYGFQRSNTRGPVRNKSNKSNKSTRTQDLQKTPRSYRAHQFSETQMLTQGVMSIGMSPSKHQVIQLGRSPDHSEKRSTMMSTNVFSLFGKDEEEQQQSPSALSQVLKAHNIASITLCSVFGTGLLVRTATTLETCGPIPLLVAFMVMSLLCYQVLSALCEMCSYIPLPNAYSGYTERFVDPALGYTLGYCYLAQYLIIGPSEIFAGAMTVQYWVPPEKINPAVWISLFLVVLLALNYLDVAKIAIAADTFVLLKVLIYFFIIITLLVVVSGGTPSHDVIGFRFWKTPGIINNKHYSGMTLSANTAVSFISAITTSVFPFTGVESFCVAVSEARYPRKTIPKAKNIIFFFVIVCYLPIVFLIGLAVAYNDPHFPDVIASQNQTTAASSAIILAVQNASLKVFPSLLNAVICIFVLSAANSALYISTRILYGLSASGLAPAVFSKTHKGIPTYSLALITAFNLLSYLGVTESTRELFNLFSNSVSGFSMILWSCILITHLCYLKAMDVQGIRENNNTYKARGGYIASCLGLGFSAFLIVFREFPVFMDLKNFDLTTFITGYISIPVFLIVYLTFKFVYKTKFIKPSEADLFFYKDCVDKNEEQYITAEVEMLYKVTDVNIFKKLYYKFLV